MDGHFIATRKALPIAKIVSAVSLALSVLVSAPPSPASTTRIYLGSAQYFAILSATGVTDVPTSAVTGWVGTTPITGAADLLTCTEVTGRVLSTDAAGPKPCSVKAPFQLGVAFADMKTAYAAAAARAPNSIELGGGNIGGLTLAPGVYRWSSDVSIPTDVTLNGGPNDVWIFEIAQDLSIASGKSVQLTGGARAINIYWQVAGNATLNSTSHFQGNILSKTLIAMNTGATITGRLLAQTAVTLQQNVVTVP